MPSKAAIRGASYVFCVGGLILVYAFPQQFWVLAIYCALAWAGGVGYMIAVRRASAALEGEPTPAEKAEGVKRATAKLKRTPYFLVFGAASFLLAAIVVPGSDRRFELLAAIVMLVGAVAVLAWVRKNE